MGGWGSSGQGGGVRNAGLLARGKDQDWNGGCYSKGTIIVVVVIIISLLFQLQPRTLSPFGSARENKGKPFTKKEIHSPPKLKACSEIYRSRWSTNTSVPSEVRAQTTTPCPDPNQYVLSDNANWNLFPVWICCSVFQLRMIWNKPYEKKHFVMEETYAGNLASMLIVVNMCIKLGM